MITRRVSFHANDSADSRLDVVTLDFDGTRISAMRTNPPMGKHFSGAAEYCAFTCLNCGAIISPTPEGSKHRNHCPHCLWSRHVDLRIGDRRSGCRGAMEPVGIWVRQDGEWALLHHCRVCGLIRANRIAGDDDNQALRSLAMAPLTRPAFPLDENLSFPTTRQENGPCA
jgi:hypothetical protein